MPPNPGRAAQSRVKRSAFALRHAEVRAKGSASPLRRGEVRVKGSALPLRRAKLRAERSALPLRHAEVRVERSALPLRRGEVRAERSAFALRQGEVRTPGGDPISVYPGKETAAHSRVNFREIQAPGYKPKNQNQPLSKAAFFMPKYEQEVSDEHSDESAADQRG